MIDCQLLDSPKTKELSMKENVNGFLVFMEKRSLGFPPLFTKRGILGLTITKSKYINLNLKMIISHVHGSAQKIRHYPSWCHKLLIMNYNGLNKEG